MQPWLNVRMDRLRRRHFFFPSCDCCGKTIDLCGTDDMAKVYELDVSGISGNDASCANANGTFSLRYNIGSFGNGCTCRPGCWITTSSHSRKDIGGFGPLPCDTSTDIDYRWALNVVCNTRAVVTWNDTSRCSARVQYLVNWADFNPLGDTDLPLVSGPSVCCDTVPTEVTLRAIV
jgi:hypothetical protein